MRGRITTSRRSNGSVAVQGESQVQSKTSEEGRYAGAECVVRGHKKWRACSTTTCRPKSQSLGSYPELSVGSRGSPPMQFKSEEAIASAKAGTFRKIAEDWFTRSRRGTEVRSAKEIRRHLETTSIPAGKQKGVRHSTQ